MGSIGEVSIPIDELRKSVKASAVLTPDSEGYEESLHRWSEAAEKRAVRVFDALGNSCQKRVDMH